MSSRRRDLPPEVGGFLVVDFTTGAVLFGDTPALFSASLENVEAWAADLDGPSDLPHAEHGGAVLTAAQCTAGRQILDWSKLQLSARAFVSKHVIKFVEAGGQAQRRARAAIRAALEAAGVEFVVENGGGSGVRLRKDQP